jgi:MFS family permease
MPATADDLFHDETRRSTRDEKKESPSPPPARDRMRWAALGQLALLCCLNNCQWINYAAIVDESRAYFGVDNTQLNILSVSYMVTFVIGAPFSIQVLNVFGLKRGVVAASVLNCLGALVKLAAVVWRPGYWFLYMGQQLAAIGQLFILGAGPLLSSQWFGEEERTIATAIATAGTAFGNAIGLLLPPLIIRNPVEGDFLVFFAIQAAVCLVDLFIGSVIVPAGPKVPPSAAANAMQAKHIVSGVIDGDSSRRNNSSDGCEEAGGNVDQKGDGGGSLSRPEHQLLPPQSPAPSYREPFSPGRFAADSCSTMGRLFSHSLGLNLLLLSFALTIGNFWTFGTLIAQMLQPFGISEEAAGAMGFASIFGGIGVSFIVSKYVDRTRRYSAPALSLSVCTTALSAALGAVLLLSTAPNVVLVGALYTLLGLTQTAFIPVILEFAVEMTFPTDEAVSSGGLMMVANLSAAITTLGLQPALGNTPDQGQVLRVYGVTVVLYAVATAAIWFAPERRLRLAFEQAASQSGSRQM